MPIKPRHYLVYDLECSGLNPYKLTRQKDGSFLMEPNCEIVQIGARVIRYSDYEPHSIGDFEVILKPQFPENASPKAIEIIGKDLWYKALAEGVDPKVGLRKFKEYIDQANYQNHYSTAPYLTGFNNTSFDNDMLDFWMMYHGIFKPDEDRPWAYRSSDVADLMHAVFGRDSMPNHKLETYASMLGIHRQQETHDGMEDTDITSKLLARVLTFLGRVRVSIQKQQSQSAE